MAWLPLSPWWERGRGGYGLSLDVKSVPVAVVLEDPSPEAAEVAAGFRLSPYFDARLLTSMPPARQLMLARKVDGIVRLRPDPGRDLALGNAEVQVLVHGTDANRARIIQGYAQAAVASGRRGGPPRGTPSPPGRWSCRSGSGSTRPTTAITSSSRVWWCW
jgi:ABC-2 type transport system permease protein